MTTTSLTVRFKDPSTNELLRRAAEQLGVPMTTLAEEAIRHTSSSWAPGSSGQSPKPRERSKT